MCRDVFDDPTELTQHEQLHKFPGGFACVICNETFLSESDCIRHTEDIHKVFAVVVSSSDGSKIRFSFDKLYFRLSSAYAVRTNHTFPSKHHTSNIARENMTVQVDMRFAWSAVSASKRRVICGTVVRPSFVPFFQKMKNDFS